MAFAFKLDELAETPTSDEESQTLLPKTARGTRTHGIFRESRTFLANELPDDPYVEIKGCSSIPIDANLDSSSLRAIGKLIVRPYDLLFKAVAWKPLFSQAEKPWQRAMNYIHPAVVLLIIVFGYIIQWEGCLAYSQKNKCIRPNDNPNITDITTFLPITTTTIGDVTVNPKSTKKNCANNMLLQFAILNLLHTASYLYSLYSIRCAEPEQVVSLQERVFLFMKQLGVDIEAEKSPINSARRLLYSGIVWLVLCLIGDSMYLYSRFDYMFYLWICTTPGRIVLCCAGLVSFTLLNAVYVTIVVAYALQCRLLALYMDCLINRIRENTISLFDAMEKCDEIEKGVDKLNRNAGISVSIVLINFAAIIVMDGLVAVDTSGTPENNQKGSSFWIWYASNILSIILTLCLLIVIIIEAVSLSRRCRHLHRMGLEVRVRSPLKLEFAQADRDQHTADRFAPRSPVADCLLEARQMPMEINTFLFYMSKLKFSAKLFMVPVRGGHVCLICIGTAFVIFIVYQLQDISAAIYSLRP